MKYVVLGVILVLLGLLVAEPMMTVGKRIASRFKRIGENIEEDTSLDNKE